MKKKKLFLGLGSIAALTTPIISVVSCGVGTGFSYKGSPMTKNGRSKFSDAGVVYQDHEVFFNFNESTSKKPFTAFLDDKGSIPTLAVAQAFEKAAGIWNETEYTNIHDNNTLKIKEGEMITVRMGMEVQEDQLPNEEHSTTWGKKIPFEVAFKFPFHMIKNMKLDNNETKDKELKEFYTSLYPYGIQSNFLKALDMAISNVIQKADMLPGQTISWNGINNIKQTHTLSQTTGLNSPSVWKGSVQVVTNTNASFAALKKAQKGQPVVITEAMISKIYTS